METMQSIAGIYDGQKIEPFEKIKSKKKYKVIITFVEELKGDDEQEAIRTFASQSSGLEFWNDVKEDLYQDFLTKKKK